MNASIYAYNRNYLLNESTRMPYNEMSKIHIMSELSAFDIDREIDFKLVEFILDTKLAEIE